MLIFLSKCLVLLRNASPCFNIIILNFSSFNKSFTWSNLYCEGRSLTVGAYKLGICTEHRLVRYNETVEYLQPVMLYRKRAHRFTVGKTIIPTSELKRNENWYKM